MVECGGLENRCAARHRGFKSYFLRQNLRKARSTNGLFHILNDLTLRGALAAQLGLNRSAWPIGQCLALSPHLHSPRPRSLTNWRMPRLR